MRSNTLEERGALMVSPGEQVYEGMIVGENAKPEDLEVNPLKAKALTNFRVSGKEDTIRLTPPKRLTLEQAIAYIDEDELVEVTPKSIRLRKRHLDPHERKRANRAKAAEPPSAATPARKVPPEQRVEPVKGRMPAAKLTGSTSRSERQPCASMVRGR